jgi:hypothetical protein
VHDVGHEFAEGGVRVRDETSKVAVYVATPDAGLRGYLEKKHAELMKHEASYGFDPVRSDEDFEVLRSLLPSN